MPKKLLATTIIIATVIASVVSTLGVEAVYANPFPMSTMGIGSPQSYATFIYQNTTIPLTIALNLWKDDTSGAYPQITRVTYSLDNHENITISEIPKSGTETAQRNIFGTIKGYILSILLKATLTNLLEGKHTLNAYSFDTTGAAMSDSVTFEVLTTYKIPDVWIVSPLDQVYRTSEIPLTCIIRGEYEQLSYRIDGSNDVPIRGNTTISITGLLNGCHTLTVYAKTPGRYGGSNWTYFIVGSPTNNPSTNPTDDSNPAPSATQIIVPTQNPTPTANQSTPTSNTGLPVELNPPIVYITLAIVIAIVAVASVALVYFKRRKSKPA
jgi:hypothetical protein